MNPYNINLIIDHFPSLDDDKKEKFSKCYDLYVSWNNSINVISRKDIDQLFLKHILHSLAIAKIFSFPKGTSILDIGTGGGFPGIPLAIFFPDVKFHLVDSIGKKIKVVEEVTQALNLTNVRAEHTRAENVKDKYHFITNRAVTRMSNFLPWVQGKFKEESIYSEFDNGIISLKGGDLEIELSETRKPYQIWNIQDFFNNEFFETKNVVYLPMNN